LALNQSYTGVADFLKLAFCAGVGTYKFPPPATKSSYAFIDFLFGDAKVACEEQQSHQLRLGANF